MTVVTKGGRDAMMRLERTTAYESCNVRMYNDVMCTWKLSIPGV